VRNCEKKLEQFMDKCVNQVCLSIIYGINFEKFAQYCFSVNKQQSDTTSAADWHTKQGNGLGNWQCVSPDEQF